MVRTALVAVIAALTLVGVASGRSTAAKQRVAIEGKFSFAPENGTFKLVPLGGGTLKRDSGKFKGTGNISPSFVRKNGQEVTVITGTDTYQGAKGTLVVSQIIEAAKAGGNYDINTGTWRVIKGTGAYEGYAGGGTFTAVGLPNGTLLFREEGYLAKS
jgi:hypothetical protein